MSKKKNKSEVATESKEVKPSWDGKLSYSSFSTYMSCARKYYLGKVKRVPIDDDTEEDTLALRYGKAFHKLLEDSMHDVSKVKGSNIKAACAEFELDFETVGPQLVGQLRHYRKIRNQQDGLSVVKCEVQVLTPTFRGFIDVVFKDKNGWWIGDLKTASSFSQHLLSKLKTDWQLNLYSYHVKEIAAALNLDPEEFRGCRYLLNVKTKLKRGAAETFSEYSDRCEYSQAAYDIAVEASEMAPETIYNIFSMIKVEIDFLHKAKKPEVAERRAVPNFTACTNYFKACEYWSNCHGGKFTELRSRKYLSSREEV